MVLILYLKDVLISIYSQQKKKKKITDIKIIDILAKWRKIFE